MNKYKSIHTILGSSVYSSCEREKDDYYATEPKALELLLEHETFDTNIWECACGGGHLCQVLENHGYSVKATDLIDRGYGIGGIDFLLQKELWKGDILTNPPYKHAQEFVEHALSLIPNGNRVVMFLKIQFLEGKARRKLFDRYPPKYIYVSSSRLQTASNGDFDKYAHKNAVCYAWYIWEKGFTGEPKIRWFN